MTTLQLVLELGLLVLLLGVLVVGLRVDQKLTRLRESQGAFLEAAKTLGDASARAEQAIRQLRTTGRDIGGDLETKIDEARALRDEIEILMLRHRRSTTQSTERR